jgi:ATP-dependent Clp protease ATP-binding subunit ClpX
VKRAGSDHSLRCSFCHKKQEVVGKLISSPGDYPRVYICDECIAVCNSILEDDRTERSASSFESAGPGDPGNKSPGPASNL